MLFFSHLPSWFTKIPNPLLCNLRNGVHVTISSFARSKISSSLSDIISAASPIWNLANWRLDHVTSCSLADFGLYPVSIWIFPLNSFCVKSRHSTSDESIRRNLWPSNLKSLILKWVDNAVSSLTPSIKRGFIFSCSNSAGYEYSSLSLVEGYNLWTDDRMTTTFMLLYFELALICTLYLQETARKPLKDKLKNFLEVCSKFQPVMRYFFMENFSQPSVWFERRLAYTKSVSTTSIGTVNHIIEIHYTTYWNTCDYCSVQYVYVLVVCFVSVGYILGLGDRHIQNILIDTNTAELVHIDLGMLDAFIQLIPKVL